MKEVVVSFWAAKAVWGTGQFSILIIRGRVNVPGLFMNQSWPRAQALGLRPCQPAEQKVFLPAALVLCCYPGVIDFPLGQL